MITEYKLICMKLVKQNLLNPSQLQQQQPPVLDLLAAVLWIRNTSFILPEMKNEKKKQLSAFFPVIWCHILFKILLSHGLHI